MAPECQDASREAEESDTEGDQKSTSKADGADWSRRVQKDVERHLRRHVTEKSGVDRRFNDAIDFCEDVADEKEKGRSWMDATGITAVGRGLSWAGKTAFVRAGVRIAGKLLSSKLQLAYAIIEAIPPIQAFKSYVAEKTWDVAKSAAGAVGEWFRGTDDDDSEGSRQPSSCVPTIPWQPPPPGGARGDPPGSPKPRGCGYHGQIFSYCKSLGK